MLSRRARSLLVAALAVSSAACSGGDEEENASGAIRVCGGTPRSPQGIDVSRYQGSVDWAAVAKAGIKFGFSRVSDGERYKDATFVRNWQGMSKSGVRRGAYHFFRPGQSVEAQASAVIDAIGKLGPGDLPPVLDIEVSDGQSDATIVRKAKEWLERVQTATGRRPLIYTSAGFFTTLSGTADFGEYPLWVANYEATCPLVPKPWTKWHFWQHTDRGKVRGISGDVDLNRFAGSADDLEDLASGDGTKVSTSADASAEPAIALRWEREDTRAGSAGCYLFTAEAPAGVERVEFWADDTIRIGAAERVAPQFEARYCFKFANTKPLEVHGFDGAGRRIAFGMGSIDVTDGSAVYVRKLTETDYEIGLERPTADVTAIAVADDGKVLVDAATGSERSRRRAVAAALAPGERVFTLTAFAGERPTATLRRRVQLR